MPICRTQFPAELATDTARHDTLRVAETGAGECILGLQAIKSEWDKMCGATPEGARFGRVTAVSGTRDQTMEPENISKPDRIESGESLVLGVPLS